MKSKHNLIEIWMLCAVMLPAAVQAQYNYTTNNGAITITKYTGSGGAVTIPDTIDRLPVTSIGCFASSGYTSLTIITIGNNVTNIGDETFEDCSSLTSVAIPDSVTDIGESAFSSCSSLTNITIGNSVNNIEDLAFGFCTRLTSITIPIASPESGTGRSSPAPA